MRRSTRVRNRTDRFNAWRVDNQPQHGARLQPVAIIEYSIQTRDQRRSLTTALNNGEFGVLMSDRSIRTLSLARLFRYVEGPSVFEVFYGQLRRSRRQRRLIHEIVEWAARSEQVTQTGFQWSQFLNAHGILYQPGELQLQLFDSTDDSDSGVELSDGEDTDFQASTDGWIESDDSE